MAATWPTDAQGFISTPSDVGARASAISAGPFPATVLKTRLLRTLGPKRRAGAKPNSAAAISSSRSDILGLDLGGVWSAVGRVLGTRATPREPGLSDFDSVEIVGCNLEG